MIQWQINFYPFLYFYFLAGGLWSYITGMWFTDLFQSFHAANGFFLQEQPQQKSITKQKYGKELDCRISRMQFEQQLSRVHSSYSPHQQSIQNKEEKSYPNSTRKQLKLPVRTTQKVFVRSSSPDPCHHKWNILSSWSLTLHQYQYRHHMFLNGKAQILSLFQKLPQKTPRRNHTC